MRKFWLALALVSIPAMVAVLYGLSSWLMGLVYAVHSGEIFVNDWTIWVINNLHWLVPLALCSILWRAKRVRNEFWKVYLAL